MTQTSVTSEYDVIQRPFHYNYDPVECIEVTQWMTYTLGNATKYLWRFNYKNNPRQDLEKAVWYMERAMDLPIPDVNKNVLTPLKRYMRLSDNPLREAIQFLVMAEGYEAVDMAISLTEEYLQQL